jgi:hypothetical protein
MESKFPFYSQKGCDQTKTNFEKWIRKTLHIEKRDNRPTLDYQKKVGFWMLIM